MEELFYYLFDFATNIFNILIVVVVVWLVVKAVAKHHHSNWNHLIDNFNYSSEKFYSRLKEVLHVQGIKGVETRFVDLKEGGMLSARRTYLRVEWKEYQYDICVAPFGKGLFISWWLLYNQSMWEILIARIPFVGEWLRSKWFSITYYKVDSASMFMTYCQSAVLYVIDEITKDSGVRSLTENERKPILKEVFKR